VSDLLKDIEEYLIAGELAVADGVDLFRDKIPDSPDTVIVLSEYIGSPGSVGIGATDRSVQVIVRANTYEDARRTSWGLYKFLINPQHELVHLTPTRWGIMHGRHTPIKFQEDKQARTLFVFNLGITTLGD